MALHVRRSYPSAVGEFYSPNRRSWCGKEGMTLQIQPIFLYKLGMPLSWCCLCSEGIGKICKRNRKFSWDIFHTDLSAKKLYLLYLPKAIVCAKMITHPLSCFGFGFFVNLGKMPPLSGVTILAPWTLMRLWVSDWLPQSWEINSLEQERDDTRLTYFADHCSVFPQI